MKRCAVIFFSIFFIILCMGISSIAEEITLTTYYPAPYGAYEEFATTGDTYLATDSAGNVGIGTTTPQSKLDVEGNVAIGAAYSGTSAAPTNGLIIQGNVGVGTTSATSRLVVNGTVNAATYTVAGFPGASGSFATADGKTVTVTNGIITDITP